MILFLRLLVSLFLLPTGGLFIGNLLLDISVNAMFLLY